MIKYDPLWRTLKEKGISQYQLIKDYGIDKAQLQRLRQNLVVKTLILNRLYHICLDICNFRSCFLHTSYHIFQMGAIQFEEL